MTTTSEITQSSICIVRDAAGYRVQVKATRQAAFKGTFAECEQFADSLPVGNGPSNPAGR